MMQGSCSRDLDRPRWRELNHSPVALLNEFPLARLEERAAELGLESRINYAYRRSVPEYRKFRRRTKWGARTGALRVAAAGSVAYVLG